MPIRTIGRHEVDLLVRPSLAGQILVSANFYQRIYEVKVVSETILATSPISRPEKIVMHAITIGLDKIDIEHRIEGVALLLSQAGIAPWRISHGTDW